MAIIKWHSLSADEVLSKVKGSTQGLTEGEAAKRFASLGANELPRQKPYSKLRLFFNQFNNPLMFILFGTIAVSLYLRHFSDTIMIVVVMLANTMVGYYQENKANNSIAKLQKLVKIQARVIRNGQEKEIDSHELVAGDLIILHAGAKIPADSRIIECRTFKTNEASLTGESVPSDKQTKELKNKKKKKTKKKKNNPTHLRGPPRPKKKKKKKTKTPKLNWRTEPIWCL